VDSAEAVEEAGAFFAVDTAIGLGGVNHGLERQLRVDFGLVAVWRREEARRGRIDLDGGGEPLAGLAGLMAAPGVIGEPAQSRDAA
jgi:hypothetical protein